MRRLLIAASCASLFVSSAVVSFASTGATEVISDGTGITIDNNKEKISKEYVRTDTGENTSDDDNETYKTEWTDKIYNVYYVNVSTGKKRLSYKEHRWTWKGYKKNARGKYVYIASKSGMEREHLDPISFLNDFMFTYKDLNV